MNKTQRAFCICMLIASILVLGSCQHDRKKNTGGGRPLTPKQKTTDSEAEVVNLIMNLDEVKQASLQVKKDSKGKRNLATYVDTSPTVKDANYWVKVAEDNGDSYVAYYTFAVDQKTHNIKFYDAVTDSLIPLDQWRKTTPAGKR